MVQEVNFINSRISKTSFVRVKILHRDLIAIALIDSGNLAHSLMSYDLARTLRANIQTSNIQLRAPNQSDIQVIGSVPVLKFYIEQVPVHFEIRNVLVVNNLAYPLNLGRTFLSDEKAQLDFTQIPGFLHTQGVKIPLIDGRANLLDPSLDHRFLNAQDRLRQMG